MQGSSLKNILKSVMTTKKTQVNIPKGWQQVKLGDISDITNGKTNSQDAIVDGEYPLFDRSVAIKRSNKYLFDATAVILPGEGAEFVPRYYKGKFDLHQRAYAILPNEDIDPLFLFQYLNANRAIFAKNAVGSTVKSLRLPIIKAVDVSLPSLVEQKKISEILIKLDENIQKTGEIITAIEKLKCGLMQRFFESTKYNGKIGDYSIHIGSGATPRGGSKIYKKEGISFIRSQNVYFSGLITDNLVFIDQITHKQMNRSRVYPNDILLNITGASLGRTCIAPECLKEANVNQHVCIIRTNEKLNPQYLFYFLQSEKGQEQIFKFQAGGNREGLNFQQIRSIIFPLPKSKDEQTKVVRILSLIDEKILINQKLKENLTLLKKCLTRDLLSVKVRVKI